MRLNSPVARLDRVGLVICFVSALLLSGCRQLPTSPTTTVSDLRPDRPPQGALSLTADGFLAGCLRQVELPQCFETEPVVQSSPLTRPHAPRNLAAFVVGNSVTLTWQPPITGDPIDTYIIEAGEMPGLSNFVRLPIGLVTSLSASGIGPGVYYVRVRAANAAGVGNVASNEAVVIVGGAQLPSVQGTWLLQRTGDTVRFPWIGYYSTLTVALSQVGATLSGTILPHGGQYGATAVGLGYVSSTRNVMFGSESAYWSVPRGGFGTDSYFFLSLDDTGRRMTGRCFSDDICTSATAVKVQ